MLDELLEGDLFSPELLWGVLAMGILGALLLWVVAGDGEAMALLRSAVRNLVRQVL